MLEQLQQFNLESLIGEQMTLATLLYAVTGLLCCFFGCRALCFLLETSGFIALGLAGAFIAAIMSGGNLIAIIAALILGGVVGGFLTKRLFRLVLLLVGGGFSGLALWNVSELLPDPGWTLPAMAVAGCLGGVGAMVFKRVTLTLTSAFVGAWLTSEGFMMGLAELDIVAKLPESGTALANTPPGVAAWAILGVAGAVYQFLSGNK